jgi:hypothetical protein
MPDEAFALPDNATTVAAPWKAGGRAERPSGVRRARVWSMGVVACLSVTAVALGDGQESPPEHFSWPTAKGKALQSEPFSHRLVYEDSLYAFRLRHYGGEGTHTPAFLALRLADSTWIEITHLSTEHARFGRSPDILDIPLAVVWDFSRLADSAYAALPLHTSGSIVFPDRVSFEQEGNIYRFDCNSQLDRPQCLTTFWVLRADLDRIGADEPP